MILHIIPAEKFVDRAISLFEEAYEGDNDFYVFTYGDEGSLEYLKKPIHKNIKIVNGDIKWWKSNFIDLKKYNTIVLHNLYSEANIYFANKFKGGVIVAMIWGYEFYSSSEFWKENQFSDLTLSYKNQVSLSSDFSNKNQKSKLNYKIHRALKLVINKEYRISNPTLKTRIQAFKNINVLMSHVETDIHNIKERFGINPQTGTFSYYTYEDYTQNLLKANFTNNILVGNSASVANNHLEVFEVLLNKKQDFIIICPLNYGNKDYAEFVKTEGYNKFGNRFHPLETFLLLEDFNRLQEKCGIVIMNHFRQQAAGNTIAALILGSKVFMSCNSPLYLHFKNIGIHVFTVEHDLLQNDALEFLPSSMAEENKKILQCYYEREVIINSIREHVKQ